MSSPAPISASPPATSGASGRPVRGSVPELCAAAAEELDDDVCDEDEAGLVAAGAVAGALGVVVVVFFCGFEGEFASGS